MDVWMSGYMGGSVDACVFNLLGKFRA